MAQVNWTGPKRKVRIDLVEDTDFDGKKRVRYSVPDASLPSGRANASAFAWASDASAFKPGEEQEVQFGQRPYEIRGKAQTENFMRVVGAQQDKGSKPPFRPSGPSPEQVAMQFEASLFDVAKDLAIAEKQAEIEVWKVLKAAGADVPPPDTKIDVLGAHDKVRTRALKNLPETAKAVKSRA